MQSGGFAMKHEKQQRFSIRKYAVGAASVLIGFAFQAQTVAADGVTPTTENQPTIHTVSNSPQSSENRTEETPKAELQPEAPKTVETETPAADKVASLPKTEEKPQEEVSSTSSDKAEVVTPTSAEKETAKPVEKVTLDFAGNEAKEVQLDATGDWKYFSLKNGEVTPATPADDLTWDIAFKGYYVKLNGGTSGKGKAEVFRTEEKDFTKVTEAPKKGFEKDKEVTFTSRDGSSSKENVSPILTGGFGSTTGAIGLNPANIAKYGNVYGPNEWVYVIKTADGTYAKIQVTDFYNQVGDKKVPGFPKLKYQLSKTVSE